MVSIEHPVRYSVDKLRMIEPAPTEADKAYAERNKPVRFLAALYASGIKKTAIEGGEPGWQKCVFIDTPLRANVVAPEKAWNAFEEALKIYKSFAKQGPDQFSPLAEHVKTLLKHLPR